MDSKLNILELKERFDAGQKYIEIACAMKCSMGTISRVITKLGWYRKKEAHNRYRFSIEEENLILDLYKSHPSVTYVSEKTGFGWKMLARFLADRGFKIRHDKTNTHKLKIDEDIFTNIEEPWEATFLGWMASDGTNNGKTARISINAKDKAILEKFSILIYGENIILEKEYKNQQSADGLSRVCYLSIYRKKICETLQRIGIGGKNQNKTDRLKWPNGIPKQLEVDFLRGYFDGDGFVNKTYKTQEYMTKNGKRVSRTVYYVVGICGCKMMMEAIRIKLGEYGIKSRIHWAGPSNPRLWNIIMCGQSEAIKFLDWIYQNKDLALERKYSTYLEFKNFVHQKNNHSKDS